MGSTTPRQVPPQEPQTEGIKKGRESRLHGKQRAEKPSVCHAPQGESSATGKWNPPPEGLVRCEKLPLRRRLAQRRAQTEPLGQWPGPWWSGCQAG